MHRCRRWRKGSWAEAPSWPAEWIDRYRRSRTWTTSRAPRGWRRWTNQSATCSPASDDPDSQATRGASAVPRADEWTACRLARGPRSGSVTRDILVNDVPAALTNPAYITLSLIAGIVGYRVAFKTGQLFREGLFEFVTSASLCWFAIIGAQKGVQVGLPAIGVLLLAVVAATAGRYFIDLTSGVTPKLFVRGEWYVGTALLAGIVWAICDTAGLKSWLSTGVAFLVAYTVRVLAMYRGWEEPMVKEPPGVHPHDDARPLLGPKLTGKSEQERRDLGLIAEDGPDEDEAEA
jgi:uncharacterized membrane protein YeiH